MPHFYIIVRKKCGRPALLHKFLSMLVMVLLHSIGYAQPYYLPNEKLGPIGTMYAPSHYLIPAGKTNYHKSVPLYATKYLRDPNDPASTSVALCSFKNEALGLYGNVEVVGEGINPDNGIDKVLYPFASPVSAPGQNGPFNTMPHLNTLSGNFTHPHPSLFGISVLAHTQEFHRMTYNLFGWKGADKDGLQTVTNIVSTSYPSAVVQVSPPIVAYNVGQGLTNPQLSRDVIGHESTHLIWLWAWGNGQGNEESYSLGEGFADVIGGALKNYSAVLNDPSAGFANPDWSFIIQEQGLDSERNFTNSPHLWSMPECYKGLFWKKPGDVGYDPHANGMVLNKIFFRMNVGETGYIDQNPAKGTFIVLPLIPNNPAATYELSLKLFFRTFTEKLSWSSTFPDVRVAMLEMAEEMGYADGSHVYQQIQNAFKAAGIGDGWGFDNADCVVGPNTLAQGWNGLVPISVQVASLDNDPQGKQVHWIADCQDVDVLILTEVFNPISPDAPYYAIDLDNDGIYTIDNNVSLSKSIVSLNHGIRASVDHFAKKFNFIGLKGTSKFIEHLIGSPSPNFIPGAYLAQIKSDSDPAKMTLDQIAGNYFAGIYNTVKSVQLPESKESIAIRKALMDIFGLEISNEYRLSKGDEALWTIGSDLFGDGNYLRSFFNPKSKGQLNFYNGKGWDVANPDEMAGVWTQFYYLISKGTPLTGFTNENGQTRFFTGLEDGVPEKIMFAAFQYFLPSNPTFDDVVAAIQSSILFHGYKETSGTWKKCNDALTCVIGKEFLPQPKLWAVDADGNEVKIVDPFNAQFRSEEYFPDKIAYRLFEVSKDVAFNDLVSPVYRAFQHTTEVLLPYIDEKDPGKRTNTAKFFLEEGTFYVRSRLYAAGGPGCASSLGGNLECRALEMMVNNWSPILQVTVAPITTKPIAPLEHDKLTAWKSVFEWEATPGAAGYVLRVTDLTGKVPVQDVPVEATSDEAEAKELALAKERDYSWQITATHKLGSEEGVTWDKGLKKFVQTGLTETDIFGTWTDLMSFQTDLPESPLLVPPAPANGEHVPPFGQDILLSADEAPGASGYRYHIQDKKNDRELPQVLYDHENLKLPDISDGKVYTWAFEPYKEATPPFITEKEFGKKYFSTFVVDYSLIPAPALLSPINDAVFNYGVSTPKEVFAWSPIAGAEEYDYSVDFVEDPIKDDPNGSTSELSVLRDVGNVPSKIKGGFRWKVRAKAKDEKGEWIVGPYSPLSFYWIRPAKTNLKYPSDGAQTVDNHKAEFSWYEQWAPAGHLFRLWKDNVIVFEKEVFGNSITITNLEVNTDYTWDAPAMTKTPTATHFPETYTFAHFRTGNAPDEKKNGKEIKEYDPDEDEAEPGDPNDPNDPDQGSGDVFYPQLGFTVDVKDGEFADTYSYSYKVTVTSDKGYSREWNCAVNGLGVVFIPEDILQTKVNGDLPEDTALYHFHLEITDLNGKDDSYAASPTCDFALLLYDALPAVQGKKMPLLDLIPQSGVFGGRWVGCSIDFDFEYIFSTKKPKP
ncbi:M4 family metallopeptidase [Dyadobacter sp. CY326]|uniref:M4 family metallopeptidase n=1 Tax=Dyadobacter sp. CY326 TaxID=2907300 RepID=UPI001F265188|nr:M4 family metallopeptidase [Dyadobacter sp. CY326]MCE7067975.1 M4 family metallopeptidase [Dyadobacter sp. CY326]